VSLLLVLLLVLLVLLLPLLLLPLSTTGGGLGSVECTPV